MSYANTCPYPVARTTHSLLRHSQRVRLWRSADAQPKGSCMDIQRLPRHYCSYQGHRVAYALVGRGPLIVLLHGLGGTADVWQPLLPTLAAAYTVLCPDLIGFGASDKP